MLELLAWCLQSGCSSTVCLTISLVSSSLSVLRGRNLWESSSLQTLRSSQWVTSVAAIRSASWQTVCRACVRWVSSPFALPVKTFNFTLLGSCQVRLPELAPPVIFECRFFLPRLGVERLHIHVLNVGVCLSACLVLRFSCRNAFEW